MDKKFNYHTALSKDSIPESPAMYESRRPQGVALCHDLFKDAEYSKAWETKNMIRLRIADQNAGTSG